LNQVGAADLLEEVITRAKEGKRVAIGCRHGKHRSVALVEQASQQLREQGWEVDVRHLNLGDDQF